MDKRIEKFLKKEKEFTSSEWERLWPFRTVRMSLGLHLDSELYQVFGSGVNYNFEGHINEDHSVKCVRCNSVEVFAGSYDTEN